MSGIGLFGIKDAILAGYKYHDTPDGQDCAKKVWRLSKIAFLLTPYVVLPDVIVYAKATTARQILARVGYWWLPITATAVTYGAATCMATNLRGKDDYWNVIFGGALAGGVLSARFAPYKTALPPLNTVIAFAFVAFLNKYARKNNIEFWPDFLSKGAENMEHSGSLDPYSWKRDWSTGFYSKPYPRPGS